MGVRQLEEFLGQADQKGFWIFTYANLAGAFLGAFLGNSLFDSAAPSLKLPGILVGVLLGVMTTWKVKGHPIYVWALSYLLFVLRRYLKLGLGDSTIDAGLYYRARTVEQVPFMLVTTRGGKRVPVLVHRGSGASADAWDGLGSLLAPPSIEGKTPVAGQLVPVTQREVRTRFSTSQARADAPTHSGSSDRRLPIMGAVGAVGAPEAIDESLRADYMEWEL